MRIDIKNINLKYKMGTTILPGEVRNPKGNPQNIRDTPKPGAKTDEGKLRQLISRKNFKGTNCKILMKFRNCDKCPLRERVEKRKVNGKEMIFTIPAKCPNYRKNGKCVVPHDDFVSKLKLYYKFFEKRDTISLHEAITFRILENAEIATENELIKNRQPGFYSHKFLELANNTLTAINKQKYGDKTTNQNLNINIDWTDAVIEAWEKRKNK